MNKRLKHGWIDVFQWAKKKKKNHFTRIIAWYSTAVLQISEMEETDSDGMLLKEIQENNTFGAC